MSIFEKSNIIIDEVVLQEVFANNFLSRYNLPQDACHYRNGILYIGKLGWGSVIDFEIHDYEKALRYYFPNLKSVVSQSVAYKFKFEGDVQNLRLLGDGYVFNKGILNKIYVGNTLGISTCNIKLENVSEIRNSEFNTALITLNGSDDSNIIGVHFPKIKKCSFHNTSSALQSDPTIIIYLHDKQITKFYEIIHKFCKYIPYAHDKGCKYKFKNISKSILKELGFPIQWRKFEKYDFYLCQDKHMEYITITKINYHNIYLNSIKDNFYIFRN